MKNANLAGFALCFIAGYGLGFTHHHIASFVTSGDGPSDTRLRSIEARLAQLEALQMHHHGAVPTLAQQVAQQAAQQAEQPATQTNKVTAKPGEQKS